MPHNAQVAEDLCTGQLSHDVHQQSFSTLTLCVACTQGMPALEPLP